MKNCWTCKHWKAIACYLVSDDATEDATVAWLTTTAPQGMPPHDADGCPGYAPVAPRGRAYPSACIETEANILRAPVGDWDADDDGRDL